MSFPGRQLAFNLLNPKLPEESYTMDECACLLIKWLLNCMSFPAGKVVFHLLNWKLPKQDCLMMPEYTKRIDVFLLFYKTPATLHFIFDIQFSFLFAELQMAKSHVVR